MKHAVYHHQRNTAHPALILGTILAVFLAIAVGINSNMTSNTKRQSSGTIEAITIGNIDANSAGILLKTNAQGDIRIKYGTDPHTLSSSLSRPESEDTSARSYLSFFELSSLEPSTTYYFQFTSADNTVIGAPSTVYEFTTSAKRAVPLAIQPIYGKAVTPQDAPETHAFVILRADSFAPLITPVNSDGTFLFSLCCLVSKNSEVLSSLSQSTPITLEIDTQEKDVLTYVTTLDDVVNTTTLLTVKKGKNTIRKEIAAQTITDLQQPTGTSPTPPASDIGGFSILYPQLEALIPGNQPLFKGTGHPGSLVTIQIKENPALLGRAEVSKSGSWTYNPTFKLLAGRYTALVTGRDEKGITQKLSRPFEIAKSGEAVLGDATGSATLTPTIPPQPTQSSSSATVTPTPSQEIPTVVISPTPPATGLNPFPIIISAGILVIVGLSILSFF